MDTIDTIKVRMYRQGFGDCFLLQFMSGQRRISSMLIDCGVKLHSKDKNGQDPLKAVAEDISATLVNAEAPDGDPAPYLDVLVVTHAHWDHVSGFHPDKKYFDHFKIGQVWVAWTEDPSDPVARQINTRLSQNNRALRIALDTIRDLTQEKKEETKAQYRGHRRFDNQEEFVESLEELLDFTPFSLQHNAGADVLAATITTESGIKINPNYKLSPDTEEAFDHVKQKLVKAGAGIWYHSPGQLVQDDTLFPGIRFYILGPPKNALINKDHPSGGARKETYFSLSDASLNGFADGLLAAEANSAAASLQRPDNGAPFDPEYAVTVADPLVSTLYDSYSSIGERYRSIEHDWLGITSALALQMDSDTNNTSLVMAIEVKESGKVLLFPGDAQVGSWLSWRDLRFQVQEPSGIRTVSMDQLFQKTVLYKVSHHASHNATLRHQGLELMTSPDLVALVPEKEGSYPGIPHKPLVTRLYEVTRGRVIFSLDAEHPVGELMNEKPAALSQSEWEAFKRQTHIEELYIEHTISA